MNKAEHAYGVILDKLLRLEIPPGSPLIETELVRMTGVGKTPLRDCLRRLESEKLVRIYPRRGTFASDIGLSDLTQIADLREAIEALAAGAATNRSTEQDRQALQAILNEDWTRDVTGRMDHDMAIHKAIYRATHNDHLQETALKYLNLSTRIWRMYVDQLGNNADRHVAEQRAIVTRILAGDANGAEEQARAHVRGFESAIQAVM